MTHSLTKTKTQDPLIFSLLKTIREKRSLLKNLECIDSKEEFSNIICDEKGKRFYIDNEFHTARGFRKLHVEVAEFSKSLKILHCVFFPDPNFDIPIFGLDVVKVKDAVSAAIVDLSPVSNCLNNKYCNLLNEVDKRGFSSNRAIPSWGNIFSKYVFFASLKNENEQLAFCKIVDQYLSILIKLSNETEPDLDYKIIKDRISSQKNYCTQQMKNEKTSKVLLRFFDEKWVKKYIKEVLFDF